jgi:hypothetical protein
MHRFAAFVVVAVSTACAGQRVESVRSADLEGALEAIELNIAAIQRHDTEAYLTQYLSSPELVIAGADSLRRGYMLFAEARRASDQWPESLITETPTLVWIAPGVVWGGFAYVSVVGPDTTRGVTERLLLKTTGGWKIAVTGSMERCE